MIAALTLDAIVIGILLCCVWQAAKKGFLRTVVQMLAYVVVFAVSMTVSRAAAPVIYEQVLEPAIFTQYLGEDAAEDTPARPTKPTEQKNNARLVDVGQDAPVMLLSLTAGRGAGLVARASESEQVGGLDEETVQKLIDEVMRGLEENGASFSGFLKGILSELDPAQLGELDLSSLQALLDEEKKVGLDDLITSERQLEILRQIADQTIRPTATGIITVVAFSITFGILLLVTNLLLGMLGFVRHIPIIGSVNSFFGGVVGLLQGALLVWVLALLVYGVLKLTGGSWWVLSNAVVDRTFLFQYFIFQGLPVG